MPPLLIWQVAPVGMKDERESTRCASALEELARANEEELAAAAAHEAACLEAVEEAAGESRNGREALM